MTTETEELTKNIHVAVQALAKSVRSIIADEDIDYAQTSSALAETFQQYQAHLRDLIPAGISKAVTAAVEVAKIKSRAAANEEGQPMKGNQMTQVLNFVKTYSTTPPDPQATREIISIAKSINAGTAAGNFASRASWFQVMKRLAEQDRKSGQSSEQAFAAFIQTPDGSELFKAYKNADGPDVEPVAVEAHVAKFGPGMMALHKRADQIREGTSMSRAQAVAKIATSPADVAIWRAAKSEQFEQV
jgi:hypothetical protein